MKPDGDADAPKGEHEHRKGTQRRHADDSAAPPHPAFLAEPQPAVIVRVRPTASRSASRRGTCWSRRGARRHGRRPARLAYLRADPRVSLTGINSADWYTHVSLQGRIVGWRDDEGLVDIDRLSRRYRGAAYSNRERPRVSAWIAIERWHGWGHLRG